MRNARPIQCFSLLCFTVVLGACGGGGGGGDSGGSAGGGGGGGGSSDALTLSVVAAGSSGSRVAAQFIEPADVAADATGNVYVADTANNTIRKISTTGMVTVLAGTAGAEGNSDGTGGAARFKEPNSLAVDSSGNVYVADTGNNTIRKITSTGVVTTLAGTSGSSGSTNGNGAAARFNLPYGVAVDGSGNVYVADTGNHVIRKITPGGAVTTLAGAAGMSGSTDANGGSARFVTPIGVAADSAGIVYVADTGNHTVRVISVGGDVTTLAGTAGAAGIVNDTGAAARFTQPFDVAIDAGGNVYVADTGNETIRKITADGVVTTMAGSGTSGSADGTGTSAAFAAPNGIATGPSGMVYVADTGNHTVRRIVATSKVVSTYGGVPLIRGNANGERSVALFHNPQGAVLDGTGNLFVADTDSAVIRKVTAAGVRSVWIGIESAAGYGEGGTGTAQFHAPGGMAIDNAGDIILADIGNHIIRSITGAPLVSTLAGTAEISGSQDGSGTTLPLAAQFASPAAVAVNGDGAVYVADTDNNTIRRISSIGVVSTLAGSAEDAPDSTNGECLAARFYAPQGIAIDNSGNIYVADTGNNTIRKITRSSGCQVTTLAGNADAAQGSTDGSSSAARFDEPIGLTVDSAGNVYVADFNNGIRKVTAAGRVSTLVALEDGDGNIVLPNPSSISISGSKYVIAAGNLVFLYQ